MHIELKDFIREVPDFPKPGIVFKDITPLLASAPAFDAAVERLGAPFRQDNITKILAIESRGFLFGGCLAQQMGCGLIPVRKEGKLPWTTRRSEYVLEYGTGVLEIHADALDASDRVLVVDDVLATGGTAAAAAALVGHFGAAIAGFAMLIELGFLHGRRNLNAPVHSVLHYE